MRPWRSALPLVEQRHGQPALVAEPPVERPLADPRPGRDVVHRHGGDAALGEERLGGGEHAHPVARRVRPFLGFRGRDRELDPTIRRQSSLLTNRTVVRSMDEHKRTSSPNRSRSVAMTTLLHVSASPRGAASAIPRHRGGLPRGVPGDPPGRPRRDLGPVGRVPAGVRPGGGAREDGGLRRRRPARRAGPGLGGRRARVPSLRRRGRLPVQRADVERGVPYILKQFIDVVSQPGMVFGFDAERGYTGLLTGRKAAVVYTSAVYGPEPGPASAPTSRRRSSTTGSTGRASPSTRPSTSAPTS